MTPKLKKIILTILIIIILFVVYAVFIKKDPTENPLVDSQDLSGNSQILDNQITQALLRIEQIKLDKSIFSDAIYKTLVDRSEPISQEPIGRANPFAPIGSISLNSNTRTSTSTPSTSTAPASTAPASKPVTPTPSASTAPAAN
jgi:hypothetical protein